MCCLSCKRLRKYDRSWKLNKTCNLSQTRSGLQYIEIKRCSIRGKRYKNEGTMQIMY
jgi:hypothetical protein